MLRRKREAECYPMSVFPTVLVRPFMPCSRFQTNKESVVEFLFEMWPLAKKAKAHEFHGLLCLLVAV